MAITQVYPKLVVDFETDKTNDEIRAIIDAVYDDLQDKIVSLFVDDSHTTILGWHYHKMSEGGSVDETEGERKIRRTYT